MLDALEAVAGRACARCASSATRASPASWPTGPRAPARVGRGQLGLKPDADFASIIRQYIADCRARPDGAAALRGWTEHAYPSLSSPPPEEPAMLLTPPNRNSS